jgi:hypothetical protein
LVLNDTSYLNNADLSIYDVTGREIYKINISNLTMQLDLSNLSSGTYFYKINSSNKTIQFGGMVAK